MTTVLIVGHGLSGAVLSHTLLDQGLDVSCIDAQIDYSASLVGAGLINPFIGPKLNLPEDLDTCLAANEVFFRKWGKKSGLNIYKSEYLTRIFKNEKQALKWPLLEQQNSSSRFAISFISNDELKNLGITASFGAGRTKTYRLNIQQFLKLSKEELSSQGRFEQNSFTEIDGNQWDIVIFAEGYNVIKNFFFNWLPFEPAQGEVLEFTGPKFPASSNGTWFLPQSENNFKSGSTWEHQNINSGPTDKGRNAIYKNLDFMPIAQYKEIDHISGIRSGSIDRNPIVGQHPEIKKYFIFNGFGSRGSTTIKRTADFLTNFITRNIPLPAKIDLQRFKNRSPS